MVTGREDDCLMRDTVVEGMTHRIRTPGQKNQYLTDARCNVPSSRALYAAVDREKSLMPPPDAARFLQQGKHREERP